MWENDRNIADDLDKSFTTDLWTAAAKRYITEQSQGDDDKPFFLYLAYDTPHAVLELPTQAYPKGGGLDGGLQWTGEPGHMINTASGTVDSYIYPEYADATYDHDKDPATPEVSWPETYQRYASSCRRIDEGIGDLVTLLKDLGIYDNTIVVFTSDNGPSREDYLPREQYVQNTPDFFNSFGPFDGIKRDTWEGGLREPTIVSWPAQIPANQVIDEPSAMYDWMATLSEAADIAAPARTDGVSLLPLLTGEQDSVEHMVYVEYFNNQPTPSYDEFVESHRGRTRQQMQMLRMGDFAGVRYDIQSSSDDFELYNVVDDPQQSTNLGADPAHRDLQRLMKSTVLQVRRPDAEAPRPYDSALVPGIEPRLLKGGLTWRAYEGEFPWVSNVSDRTPTASGSGDSPSATVLTTPGMLVWEGMIQVPEDGEYGFSLAADGAFVVRLHDALLLDGSHKYEPGATVAATTILKAGFHPFQIHMLKETGQEQNLEILWQGPGMPRGVIPTQSFYHE